MSRATDVYAALAEWWEAGHRQMRQDGITLVFDERPELLDDGVAVMVRAFRAGEELQIDPHRRFFNPPLVHEGKRDPHAAFRFLLFDSIERVPNPRGWRTKGTVSTYFASSADGDIYSVSTVYSSARSGTGVTARTGNNDWVVGQQKSGADYYCYEGFVSFPTASIPDTDTVTGVVLSLYLMINNSTSAEFTIQARQHTWGATLEAADWLTGASLASATLLASLGTPSITTGAYWDFVSEGEAFNSYIAKAGTTQMVLGSHLHSGNFAPTGNEYVSFASAEIDGVSTTRDPKLVVTHESTPPLVKMAASASMKVPTLAQSGEYVLATMHATALAPVASVVHGTPPLVKMAATVSFPNMSETDAAYPLPKLAGSGLLHVPTVAIGVSQTLVKMSATGSSPPVTSVAATVLALQKMAATARAPQVLGPSDYAPVKMAATASMKNVSLLAPAFLSAQKMGATARMPSAVAHQDQTIAPERRAKLPAGSANGSGGLETTDDHWDGPGPWDSEDTWDAVEVTLRQAQKLPPGSATVGGRLPGGG